MKRYKTRKTFDGRIKIKTIKNQTLMKILILNQWKKIKKWNIKYEVKDKNSYPQKIIKTNNGLIIGYKNGEIEYKLKNSSNSNFLKLKRLSSQIRILEFGKKKNILIYNDGKNKIIILDLKNQIIFKEIDLRKDQEIKCLKLSKDEKNIYTGGKNCTIKIHNIEKINFSETLGFHEKPITCFEISKNGKILFSSSKDKKIKIWDLEKKNLIKILVYHKNKINCLKLSKNEKYLYSGGSDCKIIIWDVKNKFFKKELGNHNGNVNCLEILSDEKLLFSGGEDHKIKLWDLVNNEFLGIFGSYEGSITFLKFSEDFKSFFVGGKDKCLKIYKFMKKKNNFENYKDSFAEFNNLNSNFKFENNIFLGGNKSRKNMGRVNMFLRGGGGIKSSISNIFTEVDFDMTCKDLPFIEKFYFNQLIHDDLNEKIFCSLIKSIYRFNKFSDIVLKFFHPITIAIFFEFLEGLKMICNKKLFKYPQFNDSCQISPIILALKIKNNEIIKVLFDFLKKKQNITHLSYREMKFLLKNDYPQIDNLLINQCKKLKKFYQSDKYIPSQTRLNKILLFSSFYQGFRESYLKKIIKNEHKKNNLRETSFYSFKFLFDFSFGSNNSKLFLKKYRNSRNKKFILSPFKHIVNYKWKRIKKYILLLSIIFWLHNIFYSLFLINSENIIFLIIDIILILFLSFYEILSLILNPKFYFSKSINYINITVLTSNSLTIILTKFYDQKYIENTPYFLNYIQILSLLLVNIRGFIHLRVFDQFRHLINMIIGVTKSTLTILVVLIYFIFASAVMYMKTRNEFYFFEAIKLNFLFLFGNLPKDSDKFNYDFSVWMLNFFVGIVTSLILVNFLIARMSGKYQDMELKQTIISLKEKVSLILEIEIFISSLTRTKEKIQNLNYTYLFIACVENNHRDRVLNKIIKKKKKKMTTKKINENLKQIILNTNSFENKNALLINNYQELNNKYDKLMEINLKMNKKLENMNIILSNLKSGN